jgi:hypothetical protein
MLLSLFRVYEKFSLFRKVENLVVVFTRTGKAHVFVTGTELAVVSSETCKKINYPGNVLICVPAPSLRPRNSAQLHPYLWAA